MKSIEVVLRNTIVTNNNKIILAGTKGNVIDIMINEDRKIFFIIEFDIEEDGLLEVVSVDDLQEKF